MPDPRTLKKPLIVAYGFDALGLKPPAHPIETPECRIEWINFRDSRSFDHASGLVIPQGIFEQIEVKSPGFRASYTEVTCHEDLMIQRERELINVAERGGWVAFLVREIFDQGVGHVTRSMIDSDLCKRILNGLGIRRRPLDSPIASVVATRDEFKIYIERYGIARTTFPEPQRTPFRTLAKGADDPVAIELRERFFFLPFHTVNSGAAADIASLVAAAVTGYRRKMVAIVPEWLSEFTFAEEAILRSERATLLTRMTAVDVDLEKWEHYKGVLVTSGELLRTRVMSILESYFGLTLDPMDEGREDFKILAADGTVVAVGESKGTNSGVKREHINQVDSHRERLGLPDTVPGLLIVNNQMDVDSVEGRRRTTIASEHIKHARIHNILIVRAIDLLNLMRWVETRSDRADVILKYILGGGGWLQVGDGQPNILDS